MASFPRKLTVSGGPKANRHKVSKPRKLVTSGKPKSNICKKCARGPQSFLHQKGNLQYEHKFTPGG